MATTKELDFFIDERNWNRGIDWYAKHFEGAESAIAIGEASPGYAMYPYYERVPERIAHLIPNVRIVYLVRDPIDRMRSHYQHRVIGGRESRPIELALLDSFYLNGSRYAVTGGTISEILY